MPGSVLVLFAAMCCVALGDVAWDFEQPDQVVTTRNLDAAQVAGGQLAGQSAWDPSVYLRLPEEGLDVSALPYLTARIYSSAPADVLDVYYKCPDGRWGLGRTEPVKRGWAVYRADLRQAGWTESGMREDARQWGGVSKRIVSFRLDPGNEADRWIVIDRVALTTKPTGELGVHLEPRGRATRLSLECPRRSMAGQPIPVKLTCLAQAPRGVSHGTVLLRLMSGPTTIQAYQEALDLHDGPLEAAHEFPVSAYSFGGAWTVRGEVLELDSDRPASAPVQVTNPRTGKVRPPRTRVDDYRGDPTLFVDGKPIPLMTFVHHGGAHGVLHREIARTGIKVFTDWFGASTAGDLGQIQPGVYDYGAFDSYFATVLDAVPDAYFLPHIGVTAPRWWQQAHPEECCLYSNGQRGPSSMASERWRAEMSADLKRLLAHLRMAPYADRILGYIFYSGYTAEWQMWATWRPYGDDYSAPALRAFRRWLRHKYESQQALRQAWRQPQVTFDTAEIPSNERRHDQGPLIRDPATDRQVIDFTQFTSDMVAEAIIHFARVTKEACDDSQIAGTYYGYMAAHGQRQPDCGHNALARVLECPDVDFLMSPPMYAHRGIGETSTFMSATESVKLHGKLWLDESDLRTYLSDPAAGYGRTKTPEESVAVTWREFANVLTRRCAVAWFDMSGGWFSGEPLLKAFARIHAVSQQALARRRPFKAEVAVFVDERSYAYYRPSPLISALVQQTIALMPQAGVTWDFYLLSDVNHARLPDYRLYVVLNAARLDEQTHQALIAKARKADATILYLHAPGYAGESALDLARLRQVTGMAVRLEPDPGPAQYRLEARADLELSAEAAGPFGPEIALAPRIVITDPEAETLARFCDGAGVAMARKTHEGAKTVYCTSVGVPPRVLRYLARLAGAHVYCETGDAFYTDGQYLALHAATDGEKAIRLPRPQRVTDVISGELLADKTTVIRRQMSRGQTLFVALGE